MRVPICSRASTGARGLGTDRRGGQFTGTSDVRWIRTHTRAPQRCPRPLRDGPGGIADCAPVWRQRIAPAVPHHPRRAWCTCERCCADRSDALRPIDPCPILWHVAGARPTSADPTRPNLAVLAAGRRLESCPWCSGQPPEIRVCCAFAAVGDGTPAWADARHRCSYAGSRPDRRAAGLLPLTAASAVNRRDPRRDPFFDASKANSCVDNAYPVGQCDQRVAFDLRHLRNVSS